MTDTDYKIDKYYALKPVQYGFLYSWDLSVSEKHSGFDLGLTLGRSKPDAPFLRIKFIAVRQLRIRSLDSMNGYQVDIRSIKDDQLEGLNYRIAENENDAFSFFCKDFSVTKSQGAYAPNDSIYCSFCGKSKAEVQKLISGPNVFICNECIGVCTKVLSGETAEMSLLKYEKN